MNKKITIKGLQSRRFSGYGFLWSWCLLLTFFFISIEVNAQTIQLGSGTTSSASSGGAGTANPYNFFWESRKMQFIYTAAEINAAGVSGSNQLNSLAWFVTQGFTGTLNNYTIKIGHTNLTALTSFVSSGLTTVYNQNLVGSTATNYWNTLNFTTPFIWNGTDNIIVEVCFGVNSDFLSSGTVRQYAGATNSFRGLRSDIESQCSITTGGTNGNNKPQCQMVFSPLSSCIQPSIIATSNVSPTSATINWNASSSNPANGYEWEVRTSGLGGSGVSGLAAFGTTSLGTNTASVSGLNENTSYTVYVRSNCGSGEFSIWTSGGSFTTLQFPATLPYFNNFDSSNDFLFINGSQTNRWFYGGAVGNSGSSIYISNNNGVSNNYSIFSTSLVFAYREFAIPADATLATLGFDWRSVGENNFDYLRVWLVPSSFNPLAGTAITSGSNRIQIGGNYQLQNNWQSVNDAIINVSGFAGQSMKLVFEWRNDDSDGTNPPVAIDNVRVEIPTCLPVSNLGVANITTETATVSWTSSTSNPSNDYQWELRTSGAAGSGATGLVLSGTTPVNETSLNLSALQPQTAYILHIRSDCSGTFSPWNSIGFTTACSVPVSPSNLVFTNVTSTTFTISYTAPTTLPSTYMVFTSASPVPPVLTNGTTYATATNHTINGEIYRCLVNASVGTTFNITGSASNSQIYYYIFSANNANNCFGGIVYSDSPLNGSVVTCAAAPTAPVVTNVSPNQASLAWTASIAGGSFGSINYNVELYTDATFTSPVSGSPFTVGSTTNFNLIDLQPSTTYFFRIVANNGICNSAFVNGSFLTPQIPASFPYVDDFSSNLFTIVNGSQVNRWFYGNATGNTGNAIYISNNNGVANAYTNTATSVVHAFRDISVPAGTSTAELRFDWLANAENCCDYIRVWLVPTTLTPTAGTQITAGAGRIQVGANLNGQSAWQTFTNSSLNISSFAGTTMRLVFEWRNDFSGGFNPPGAIDNVFLGFSSTIWNGTAWSNGEPTSTKNAVIQGDYTTTANLEANTLTVNSGVFTIASGTSVTVEGAVVNNAAATNFIVENNGNLLQNATAANVGAITVRANSQPLMRLDYTLWSSPVAGQNLKAFSPNTLSPRFYVYDETATTGNSSSNNGTYVTVLNETNEATYNFVAAQGYLIRTPNNHPTTPTVYNGVFTGVPQNGNYSATLSNVNAGYNLVGNPYPSSIDLNAFFTGNSAIENTVWFWRKTNGAAGDGYVTANNLGYTFPGQSADGATNIGIRSGQGFFVKATGAGTVSFTNGMRASNSTSTFFRNATASETPSRIWLQVANSTEVLASALVGYTSAATLGVDAGFDSKPFGASSLVSLIGTEGYAIQGRSSFEVTDQVALGFEATTAGNYSIAIANKDGVFASGQAIYLQDLAQNITHDFANGAYQFVSEAGTFNNRFRMVYENETLGIDDVVANQAYVYNNNGVLTVANTKDEIKSVVIFDIQGRVLQSASDVNANQWQAPAMVQKNQVLLVQVTTTAGVSTTKTVF